MADFGRFLGQLCLYGAFAAFIGYFSNAPAHHPLPAGHALLRLSFTHAARPVADCRKRSAAELDARVPTMREAIECPRERSPVRVRLEVDDTVMLDERFEPSGLHRDGPANAYRRLPIPAGVHRISVQVNDDVRKSEFTYRREARLQTAPGQVVLIDLAGERGGIVIK
ncbi:MAG: hypothetical protein H6934_11935 [Burkholderiaceae bacterium]|nr:hypothetical protein [Burkholderiaceae bacterium]